MYFASDLVVHFVADLTGVRQPAQRHSRQEQFKGALVNLALAPRFEDRRLKPGDGFDACPATHRGMIGEEVFIFRASLAGAITFKLAQELRLFRGRFLPSYWG